MEIVKILLLVLMSYTAFLIYHVARSPSDDARPPRWRDLTPTDKNETVIHSLPKFMFDVLDQQSKSEIMENIKINLLNGTRNETKTLCPSKPPNLYGRREIKSLTRVLYDTWEEINKQNPLVKEGMYAPEDCEARFRVAIIIPFRDRELHLKNLMKHLHPVLLRQMVEYTIYVVSLAGNGPFNRAKLLNIGVVEANRDREYDCYIFHDVDLLVEDDQCLYWCSDEPRQISCRINKFRYKPITYGLMCPPANSPKYTNHFGGVSLVSHNLFLEVNGFSNLYWGWGGEDDDMYLRLWKTGHGSVHSDAEKCTFSMIKHKTESTNTVNPARYALLKHSIARMDADGLNTLRYRRIALERKQLFVNVTVDIGEAPDILKTFMKRNFSKTGCENKMPWE